MTDGLVEFLRAREAEREQGARRAGDVGPDRPGEFASWTYDREHFRVTTTDGRYVIACRSQHGEELLHDVDGEHIARHDPAWVLRDVEAKRRVIEMAEGIGVVDGIAFDSEILEALALTYADHPDYRPEDWL